MRLCGDAKPPRAALTSEHPGGFNHPQIDPSNPRSHNPSAKPTRRSQPSPHPHHIHEMSDQLRELADIPRYVSCPPTVYHPPRLMRSNRDFLKEGTQFLNRCQKPDKREFIKISQAGKARTRPLSAQARC